MEDTGGKRAKQGVEAVTFFSMAPVPNPNVCGTWGPGRGRPVPAGKERDESKGGFRKTVGGKVEMGRIWLVLDSGTGKREEEQMKVIPFPWLSQISRRKCWGCMGWWGRGQLLRKSEVAHVTLCGRSDAGARGVCHHCHLGP